MNNNTAMKRYTQKFFVADAQQKQEMTSLYNGALEEFGETCEEEAAQYVLDVIATANRMNSAVTKG